MVAKYSNSIYKEASGNVKQKIGIIHEGPILSHFLSAAGAVWHLRLRVILRRMHFYMQYQHRGRDEGLDWLGYKKSKKMKICEFSPFLILSKKVL